MSYPRSRVSWASVRQVVGILWLVALSPFAAAQDYGLDDSPFRALLFGEVDYRQTDGPGSDGFTIGQLVGQLNAEIDDKLSVFTELTATARRGEDYEFEIERMFVRYDFSDMYKLSAGRFHTPIGYWNTAYHHGSWLQTTIGRPEGVKFGSYVMPIHFMGVQLEGKLWDSDFGYRVGFGNGRCEEINDPCDLGDSNSHPAYLAEVFYRPLNRFRLDTGLTLYVDSVTPAVGPEVDETIIDGYIALQGERPELIAEYLYGIHERKNTIGPEGNTNTAYLQLAYRLGGRVQNLKPYVRAEFVDVDADDPLLGDLGLDYDGYIGGLRWDFSRWAALKTEVRSQEFDHGSRVTSFWIQLAFVFDAAARKAEIRSSRHQVSMAGVR